MGKMNLKQVLDFSFGLFCTLFAISMFFFFPGMQAWTFSALHPFASFKPAAIGTGFWINLLMVFAVFLPGVFGPVFLVTRARRYAQTKLIGGCLALAALFLLAALGTPLLYGRVALLALLSGQLLALGLKAGKSVPFNWMVYLSFALANFTFPDSGILAGANCLAGAYLLIAGIVLLALARKSKPPQPGYRVMVG
jgi:hypothetical protein